MSMNDNIRDINTILSFGPGSIYELPDKTVMILGPDYWNKSESVMDSRYRELYDKRLSDSLGIRKLFNPPASNLNKNVSFSDNLYIPAIYFPGWLICQNRFCNRLFNYYKEQDKIKKIRSRYNRLLDDYFDKKKRRFFNRLQSYIFCPFCGAVNKLLNYNENYQYLLDNISKLFFSRTISFRWIMICPEGHMDDIPIDLWLHEGALCDSPVLTFSTISNSTSLQDQLIKCKCGKTKSMSRLINIKSWKEWFTGCSGKTMWLRRKKEKCNSKKEDLKVVQKGDSNVYYPNVISSISIPPFDIGHIISEIIKSEKTDYTSEYLLNLNDFRNSPNNICKEAQDALKAAANRIIRVYAVKTNCEVTEITKKIKDLIREIVTDDFEYTNPGKKNEEKKESDIPEYIYRFEEYRSFINPHIQNIIRDTARFEIRKQNITENLLPYISNLVIADDLTITLVLKGFTRVYSPYYDPEQPVKIQRIKSRKDWLPAVQVRGEGIFIEFNNKTLDEWYKENREIFIKRFAGNKLEKKDIISITQKNIRSWAILYLLHSFSHYLINILSFESGYNAASLRERLYISDEPEKEMNAILISTSTGDSEASLGGLAYMGNTEKLETLINKTINKLSICSNDPVCAEGEPSGNINNYAACFSCLILPETSCELGNRYLDRMCLIGNQIKEDIPSGFFNKYYFKENEF